MHQTSERKAAQQSNDSAKEGLAHRSGGVRVLLVGSHVENARTLQGYLAQASQVHVETVQVGSPAEVLPLTTGEKYQAVLYDLTGVSDLAALQALAQSACNVPIIALLGQGDAGLAMSALQVGAEECLEWADLDARVLERAILHSIERKRAENDLRISEARFRALFEQSPNPICIHRPDGLSLSVNQAVLDRFKMTSEQASRYSVLDDTKLLSQPGVAEAIDRTFLGEATTIPRLKFSSDEHGWTDEALMRLLTGIGYPIKGQDGAVQEVVLIWDDVTEQVQAEARLRETESQYHAIFQATTDGIAINDMDGNLVEANPAFCAMHGYTHEEMLSLHPSQFIHESSVEQFHQFFVSVKSGRDYRCEAVDVRKDGSTFHIEVHGRGFIYRGKPHTLAIVRDISERVEIERELRAKEEQYRAIFEASTDGLVIGTMEGVTVAVNPAFARMHGYTPGEMIGMDPRQYIHPSSHAGFGDFVREVSAGRPYQREAIDVRKDGSTFHVETSGTILMYQGKSHLLGIIRDVTERVLQEEQLRLKEEQYRAIFEATSDGLVISDLEGNVLEVNPAFAAMEGYTREELVGMDPHVWIHPSSHRNLADYLEKVKNGERYSVEGLQVRKDGTIFHAEVHEAPFIYNGQRHTLAIIRDITERVQARELLERRVEERTRELATLLDVSSNVASTLELEPLLSRILEQLGLVVSYVGASVMVLDGDDLVMLDSRGADGPEPHLRGQHFPLDRAEVVWKRVIDQGWLIIPDTDLDEPLAREYRESLDGRFDTFPSYIRTVILVPMVLKDKVIGLLSLTNNEPHYYTERHAKLAVALANQAAVAIENARLYKQAQQAARSTAALSQIASRVAYGGSLQETLDEVCQHVVSATGAVAAGVILYDPDSAERRMVGTYGMPEGYAEAVNAVVNSGTPLFAQEAFDGYKPVVIGDIRRMVLESAPSAPLHPFMPDVSWDAVVAVPMVYRDTQIGVLASYVPTRDIKEVELAFHAAIADQTAVAVENARLLVQAHDKARLEERQRLARELHDSVTQALFSTNLIARSLEVMLQREGTHSAEVMEKMADLRQLTHGAMAEMRSLIFELRPGALEEEGLMEALRKHAAGIQGREGLRVDVTNSGDGVLPRLKPEAEEALYRIAQEALHNVVKHARATRVEVSIGAENGAVAMRIKDDGKGFDADNVPAGHMGLGTMGQRAEALQAEYRVQTAPGQGTCIEVRVPLK